MIGYWGELNLSAICPPSRRQTPVLDVERFERSDAIDTMTGTGERLLTSAFIVLAGSDLVYFTASGLLIRMTPFFVTGPLGSALTITVGERTRKEWFRRSNRPPPSRLRSRLSGKPLSSIGDHRDPQRTHRLDTGPELWRASASSGSDRTGDRRSAPRGQTAAPAAIGIITGSLALAFTAIAIYLQW